LERPKYKVFAVIIRAQIKMIADLTDLTDCLLKAAIIFIADFDRRFKQIGTD
jgi:hypothetical protein